jgi:hypothetical protein
MNKLYDHIQKQDKLMIDLRQSTFLYTVLWPNQKKIKGICYGIKGSVALRPDRYLVLTNQDNFIRVIKFTLEQFKASPIHDVQVYGMDKHMYPNIKREDFTSEQI